MMERASPEWDEVESHRLSLESPSLYSTGVDWDAYRQEQQRLEMLPRPAAAPAPDIEAQRPAAAPGLEEAGVAGADASDGEESAFTSGMKVTWKGLTYTVTNSANRKEKIKLLTEMGPSGSSKTTLLDILAGRKTVGKIDGTILFGGTTATRTFLRRYTGYVEQFDTLLDNLTVQEMLLYTAELKNPMREPQSKKVARVDGVLDQLSLAQCRGVRIGSQLHRGISGGQCKRVNIGIALVTNPRVLFLDEPTSGLDSYTANEVMTVVKGLVKGGITICATIHSPTPYCFNLFDRLMILLHGRVVYFGENGPNAIEYFQEEFPDVTPFGSQGSFFNKAEWIVDLTTKADREGRHLEFAERYAASKLAGANTIELEAVLSEKTELSPLMRKELATRRETANPFFWGIRTLLKYRMTRDMRDVAWLGPRIVDKLVLALIIMSLYWRVGANQDESNVSNLTAVLFLWAILPGYTASSYVPMIVLERPLYIRERNDGLYRPITYLLSKMIEELSIALMNSFVMSALVFFPCALAGQYVHFWLVYLTTTSIGIALGYFVAAMSPNMDVANAALPAYVTVLLFFVGLLLRSQDQPAYWHWFSYIDFLKYAWAAQMINQFENSDLVFPLEPWLSVLQFYNLDGQSKWANLGYEALFFLGFSFLAWAALAFKRHQSR